MGSQESEQGVWSVLLCVGYGLCVVEGRGGYKSEQVNYAKL